LAVTERPLWVESRHPLYSFGRHGIAYAAYTSDGTSRRAHHATRPAKAPSTPPKVMKPCSETPKSARDRNAKTAPTGTKSAVSTIAAITTIWGIEPRTKRISSRRHRLRHPLDDV